jgi:metal-responsive CopG/Arc/MetJ family transcriptional regulator
MSKKTQQLELKKKNKNMNVKLPEDVYRELQQIADDIGGMSLSSMIRTLIFTQLDKTRKSGDPLSFLDIKKK